MSFVIESLESRTLLSSSAALDRMDEAQHVGAVTSDRTIAGALLTAADVNIYSFSVAAGQRVAFDLDRAAGATLDGYLRLFDVRGHELAFNDNGAAPNEDPATVDPYLAFTFGASGKYFVGVSGAGNFSYNPLSASGASAGNVGANGAYTLHVNMIGGSGFTGLKGLATLSNQQTLFTIRRFGNSTRAFDPSVRTWIVIHGYQGNGKTTGMTNLGSAISAKYPSDQVLTLDWSQAAATSTYFGAEQWLEPTAVAAAVALNNHGFAGTSINLIGYSFGTYIAGETAKRMAGGVNTIVAIDPPLDAPGGYDASTSFSFSSVSRFSWTFHDTDPTHSGSAVTPTSADEAIAVTQTTHGSILSLFINLIKHTDTISQNFQLSRLLSYAAGPWRTDQYDDRGHLGGGLYEAVLGTTSGGTLPLSLSFISAATGQLVTE